MTCITVSEWREGEQTARLQFDPDPEIMPRDGVLHGQLVIQYDVERALDAGDVQVTAKNKPIVQSNV